MIIRRAFMYSLVSCSCWKIAGKEQANIFANWQTRQAKETATAPPALTSTTTFVQLEPKRAEDALDGNGRG